MRLVQTHHLIAGLVIVAASYGIPCESAPIRSAQVEATASKREAWLAQNMARNQRQWARLASRNRGISAASVKSGPTSLQEVWAVFRRSMRFANQLKPASTTGLLPNSAFVNDLWSRRAINAAQFTQYHGMIAQMLDWNTYFSQPSSTTPIVIPSVNPASNNPTSPQVIVPEPSTILISLLMVGFGGFHYLKKSRSANDLISKSG